MSDYEEWSADEQRWMKELPAREDYEQELLDLWAEWSDTVYFAHFLIVTPGTAAGFAKWLEKRARPVDTHWGVRART